MATTMTPITAKLRPDEKRDFIRIAEGIGTTPSNAIRMLVAALNKRGGFPFDPANPRDYNAETLKAMDDAASGRNLSGRLIRSKKCGGRSWTRMLMRKL